MDCLSQLRTHSRFPATLNMSHIDTNSPRAILPSLFATNHISTSSNQRISPSEHDMLAKLAQLNHLHTRLRQQTTIISTNHPSPVCQAVAASISTKFLAEYRNKIIQVEASILNKSPTHVGGYDIIPLSTVVADFAPWTRRLEWLLQVTSTIGRNGTEDSGTTCTGPKILNFLNKERHTGYTDINEFATELLKTAQRAWMQIMSSWLLYGKLSKAGKEDSMVQESQSAGYTVRNEAIPEVITPVCAGHILVIGNTLDQIKNQIAMTMQASTPNNIILQLVPSTLAELKALTYPLNSSLLEMATANINQSISQKALNQILPVNKILQLLDVTASYLLLDRGEFAITLINNMDERLSSRSRMQASSQPTRKLGQADTFSMKPAELATILNKTWSDLSSLQSDSESEDQTFTTAKQYLRLIPKPKTETGTEAFTSTLAPTSVVLSLDLSTASALSIFISRQSITQYTEINAYLLSIRRAQTRLSGLWKLTNHRRSHPAPLGPPLSATPHGRQALTQRRKREHTRSLRLRPIWSSMNNALFFINEFNAYLQGEIIHSSWLRLQTWIRSDHVVPPQTSLHTPTSSKSNHKTAKSPLHLAQAHAIYLETLHSSLLLQHPAHTQNLISLLRLIDHSIGLFTRLQTAWSGLDLQEDDGVEDSFADFAADEDEVMREMERVRREVGAVLERVVGGLKEWEREGGGMNEIDGAGRVVNGNGRLGGEGEFEPWRARTLDRLIMKLEFLHGRDERGRKEGEEDDEEEEDVFEDAL